METFINPVANGADPYVFKDTDGTYYLYITSGGAYGYRIYSSVNLVEWEARGYCLRRDDVYTDQTEAGGRKGSYDFWAPELIRDGDTYYMVYAAQEHLGIATSKSPLGPFTNTADRFLLRDRAIDGHFFRDDDGQVYLYFVSVGKWSMHGDAVPHGNNIWGGPFDLASCSFAAGYPRLLIEYDRDEGHVIAEGPAMLKHGGKYYLTYSSNDFRHPGYCVKYATSDSPTGPFVKYSGNPILQSDDVCRADAEHPHLYGTAHHCFTTSPDDSELVIVYHAHRTGRSGSTNAQGEPVYVAERRVCVDRAWFDASGVLHAGTIRDGVPTAVAQPLPAGGKRTRKLHFAGTPFAKLGGLPTVYLSCRDGSDENDGQTALTALRTMDAAYAALPNGGTILLTQSYHYPAEYTAPAVNGPVMIKGIFSAVPLHFLHCQLQSDTYFDDVVFLPHANGDRAVIDCGCKTVVLGEGVSCYEQPLQKVYPKFVGAGELRIYGGTWEKE